MTSSIYIHKTAIMECGAMIGDFTSIWHFAHIEGRAQIGENCNLGQGTYVGNNAKIGNACRIGNSVSVFSHVELEDFVFCAPFMVFTHIKFPRAAVNRHSVFIKTHVGKGASLGANSTVVPGVTIGEGAFIAAGSVLTRSCSPWALMVGSPAKQVGWVSAFGERIEFEKPDNAKWKCGHTGDKYFLKSGVINRAPGFEDILKYNGGKRLIRMISCI